MKVGTVVCFTDPEVTFEQAQNLPNRTYIAEFGNKFFELSADAKWRLFPGNKVWIDLEKVKPQPKLHGTYVLVEITDRNGGGGRYSFKCGDIQGQFDCGRDGYGADVHNIQPEHLEYLQQWFPGRFRHIDQF
jgi:hypothetical protein